MHSDTMPLRAKQKLSYDATELHFLLFTKSAVHEQWWVSIILR